MAVECNEDSAICAYGSMSGSTWVTLSDGIPKWAAVMSYEDPGIESACSASPCLLYEAVVVDRSTAVEFYMLLSVLPVEPCV